jgi:hypothetical protein
MVSLARVLTFFIETGGDKLLLIFFLLKSKQRINTIEGNLEKKREQKTGKMSTKT